MAEHVHVMDDSEGKFISSGTTSGELAKTTSSVENGGKSPHKIRKQKKNSLFKRSYPQDEGSGLKASGRGRRKSGREKKQDSRESLDEIPQAEVPTSAPVQPTDTGYPYDINAQDVEQKSSVELSVKRIQKNNKELVKQNAHLVKTVDNLKKEKELLVTERVKLKAEIKSLEKDLKKASSKDHRLTKRMSQPLIDDTSTDIDSLREKIQVLEDQLTERDHIAALLKQRLDRSNMEASNRNESEEHEKSSSSTSAVLTKNGTILDQAAALEMLLDEYETSLRLRRENEDFKSRLSVLETEVGSSKLQRDNPSPKSPRKRSTGFFKRGKKSNSSITSRHTFEIDTQQIKEEYGRCQTPEVLMKSDSHEQLDVSFSPYLTHGKDSAISILNHNSPNLSPQMPTKDSDHVEILTLQSCLKSAIEEKTACKECIAILEKELDGTRSKIAELEDSVSTSAEKATAEIERLKSSLNAARIERDTFCGELKIVQIEVDELVDKNEEMDKMFTESLKQKNKAIQDLEQEVEAMKKTRKISSQLSSNKPPAYGVMTTPAKTSSIVSPTAEVLQPKNASLGKASKDSAPSTSAAAKASLQHKQTSSSERQRERFPSSDPSPISSKAPSSRERLPSSDPSPKHEKISSKAPSPRERLPSGGDSHEKISSKAPSPRERLPSGGDSHEKISSKAPSPRERLPSGGDSHEKISSKAPSPRERLPSGGDSHEKISSKVPSPRERLPSGGDSHEKISSKAPSPRERLPSGGDSHEKISSKVPSPRERLPSSDSSNKQISSKVSSKGWSHEKAAAKSSPTRKVGRLSRESSIDRFETLPAPKETAKPTKKTSNSNIPKTSAHSAKVAATRAMFEQKIDEVKTDQPKVRWAAKTNAPTDNQRRSSVCGSVGGPNADVQVKPMHSKSYSYDYSKQPPGEKVLEQSTGSWNKPTVTPPATVKEQVNEPTIVSNEAKDKINSYAQKQKQQQQQQPPPEKVQPVSSAAVAAAAATTTRKSNTPPESVAKVSRITITSVASPTHSPVLGNRKNAGVNSAFPKGEQQFSSSCSAMLLRHPTSPSLSSSGSIPLRKTPSPTIVKGQLGQANTAKISTVSTTVRHSAPSKAATVSEMSPPVQVSHPLTVEKAQTQGQLHPSSNSNVVHRTPITTTPTTPITTSTASSSSSSNRVVVKMLSRIGTTEASKLGSLQNISTSCQVNGDREVGTPVQNSEVKVSTASTTSGTRRGPTHRAMQRRERKERPKTMYAGRAETANLVNLISRFQDADKEKSKESSPACPPKVNGTSSVTPTTPVNKPTTTTTTTTTTTLNHTSFVAPLRHSGGREKQTRPTSYCNPTPNKINSSGSNFQPSLSYNNSSSNKPQPHERIMQRSRTVAGGLGSAKQSKKAMLLKWCQVITQDYENVNICNFAESFSNGLAFCALIHHFLPEKIPFSTLLPSNRELNFQLAFQTAEGVGIPSLLDVEDMVSLPKPDWMSVMTYVSFIYNKFGQQNQQQNLQHSSMV